MAIFGNNDDKIIRFREAFQDKYTLLIKTDVLAGSIPIKTTTRIRWQFTVKKVTETGDANIELITLEHDVIAANNPNIKELARLTQTFGKMYSELDLWIDKSGKILEVNNIEQLRNKWATTKADLQSMDRSSDAVKGIIIMNDEIFITPEKMKTAIQENEFFTIYFNQIYGRKLPGTTAVIKKWNHFQQVQADWSYFIKPAAGSLTAKQIELDITGQVQTTLNASWVEKAYNSFSNIDIKTLHPRLVDSGIYTINPVNGKLLMASILKEETANPQLLFSRIEYELTADSFNVSQKDKTADNFSKRSVTG